MSISSWLNTGLSTTSQCCCWSSCAGSLAAAGDSFEGRCLLSPPLPPPAAPGRGASPQSSEPFLVQCNPRYRCAMLTLFVASGTQSDASAEHGLVILESF